MIKKIPIFALTLLMALSFTVSLPLSAAADSWYKDVADSHWAFEKIKFASDQKIISGYPGNVFKPEGMVTCEEAVSMLYGTLAAMNQLKDEQDYTEEYIDILNQAKIADWSRKVISYALKYEMITAAEVRTFIQSNGAGRPALREETAVWSAKALSKPLAQATLLSYADTSSISEAAVPYVDLVLRERVMTGDNKNQFLPRSNVKRCEFASVCKSLYDSSQNLAFDIKRDVVNTSGSVTAVSSADGKLTIKGSDGLTRHITMSSPPQSANGIKLGDGITIGYCILGEGSGISLQIMGKPQEQYILDVSIAEIQKLTSADGKAYYALKAADRDGATVLYLIDGNTSIFNSRGEVLSPDALVSGTAAKMICDGIKILELKI